MSSSNYEQQDVATSSNGPSIQTKTKLSKAGKDSQNERKSFKATVSLGRLTPPTSPPRNVSNVTTVKEKPVEKSTQSASTLKTRLDLDNWRCGSPRVDENDPPCKVQIPARKKDQINSQIDSMVTLTKSSPDLVAELEKLAMLVHCHHHDCGIPKHSRVMAWEKLFNPILSVEKQIREVFGRRSTQCIAKENVRCREKIGGQRVQNCTRTIDEIVRPEVYFHDANLDHLLSILETNMHCEEHMGEKSLKLVASWKSAIVAIRTVPDSNPIPSIESDALEMRDGKDQNPKSVSSTSNELVLHSRRLLTPRSSRSLSPELDREPSSFWAEAFVTTPFDIIAKSNKHLNSQASYELIRTEAKRALDLTDRKEGYVYLYEVEGNKGFVKIGYTGRSIAKRHTEWGFECNREPKVLYPTTTRSTVVVQNARRVEALCHAELNHRRIRIYCASCLKQHLEWFEVSAADAIAVIQKWSTWMETHPYQSIELRNGTKWTIKEKEEKRTRNMELFMKEISVVAGNPVA
jgi:hypothetical protein